MDGVQAILRAARTVCPTQMAQNHFVEVMAARWGPAEGSPAGGVSTPLRKEEFLAARYVLAERALRKTAAAAMRDGRGQQQDEEEEVYDDSEEDGEEEGGADDEGGSNEGDEEVKEEAADSGGQLPDPAWVRDQFAQLRAEGFRDGGAAG